MDNTPTTEKKWKYEWYPEIKDRNSDHPAYRLEFHQWEGRSETWKLERRNFIYSSKDWNELLKSSNSLSICSREGHPYILLEGEVVCEESIPNKEWLKWMVDALNEKTYKDDIDKRSGNKNII